MKKLMTFCFILLCISGAKALDLTSATSPPCILGPNTIEVGGQYVFTTSAVAQCGDCHDWDIAGITNIASIASGNDMTSSVTINANAVGQFTLNLTYLTENGCRTCSKTITIIEDMIDCENCGIDIDVATNPSGTLCTSATATLVGCDNPVNNPIVSVDWSYGLAGTVPPCGVPPNDCPIPPGPNMFETTIPLGTIIGDPLPYHYLQFYAVVTYTDGTECDYIWDQELLTCDDNYEDPGPKEGKQQINIYPNPASEDGTIGFDGIAVDKLNRILVLDITGSIKSSIIPTQQNFKVKDLNPGIYLIHFITTDNGTIQKRLIID